MCKSLYSFKEKGEKTEKGTFGLAVDTFGSSSNELQFIDQNVSVILSSEKTRKLETQFLSQ